MPVIMSILAALVLAFGGTIYEDSPLWDCRTMGNQVCGPGATVHGVPVE